MKKVLFLLLGATLFLSSIPLLGEVEEIPAHFKQIGDQEKTPTLEETLSWIKGKLEVSAKTRGGRIESFEYDLPTKLITIRFRGVRGCSNMLKFNLCDMKLLYTGPIADNVSLHSKDDAEIVSQYITCDDGSSNRTKSSSLTITCISDEMALRVYNAFKNAFAQCKEIF